MADSDSQLAQEARKLFPEEDFERHFCVERDAHVTEASNSPGRQRQGSLAATGTAVICLLDTKRSNNISIALSRMKSLGQVVRLMERVQQADLAVPEDALNALLKSEPTQQEAALVAAFDGPEEQLNFPEKVVAEFVRRPGLSWMLRALRHMQRIPAWLAEVRQRQLLLLAAYDALLSSAALVRLLVCARRLYELNNVLYGDQRPVQGIAIDAILEFARIPCVGSGSSSSRSRSLADYLADAVPQLAEQLDADLQPVRLAAPVDWDALCDTRQDIHAGLRQLAAAPANTDAANCPFRRRVAAFLLEYEPEISHVDATHDKCVQKWAQVSEYFQLEEDDDDEYRPTDLFHLLLQIHRQLAANKQHLGNESDEKAA